MNKVEKYIALWYSSIVLLVLGFLFFLLFLLHHSLILLFLFAGCFAGFSVLYGISAKMLSTDASFSVVQAISFYNACTRAGHHGGYTARENKLLLEIAKKRDYLKDEPEATVSSCYRIGKQTVESVHNPVLRTFWYIKSGDFKIVR